MAVWEVFCVRVQAATTRKAKVVTERASKSSSTKEVDAVLTSYRRAGALKAKVNKTVVQETMGTETKSRGAFYFSKGKLRMDIMEPERSALVYDGKNVWFESRFDDQHVQVTKMRVGELRKANSMLAALFDKKDVLKNFKLIGTKSENGKKIFSFEAKDKKKSDVQFLEIALKDKDIQRITYKDQIENRITLEFSELIAGPLPANKFAYKAPKGAEVTEP